MAKMKQTGPKKMRPAKIDGQLSPQGAVMLLGAVLVVIFGVFYYSVGSIMPQAPKPKPEQADIRDYFKVEPVSAGDGKTFPKPGNTITVHYVGQLPDGTTFDSSRQRGQPFEFTVGAQKVIPGWEAALMTFSKGQRSKIIIQPEAAYGENGIPGTIPPNSVLLFDVELLDIVE